MTGTRDQAARPSTVLWRKTRATMPLTQRSRLRAISLKGFADADGAFDEDEAAAQLFHGELEGELGAEGGFFEEEAEILAIEGAGVIGGRGFDAAGEIEEVEQLVVREVEIFQQIGRAGFEYLVRSKHGGHGERLLNYYSPK